MDKCSKCMYRTEKPMCTRCTKGGQLDGFIEGEPICKPYHPLGIFDDYDGCDSVDNTAV